VKCNQSADAVCGVLSEGVTTDVTAVAMTTRGIVVMGASGLPGHVSALLIVTGVIGVIGVILIVCVREYVKKRRKRSTERYSKYLSKGKTSDQIDTTTQENGSPNVSSDQEAPVSPVTSVPSPGAANGSIPSASLSVGAPPDVGSFASTINGTKEPPLSVTHNYFIGETRITNITVEPSASGSVDCAFGSNTPDCAVSTDGGTGGNEGEEMREGPKWVDSDYEIDTGSIGEDENATQRKMLLDKVV